MPALTAPLVGFALGVVLAWLCRAEASREDDLSARARARVATLFGALVFAPASAYFVAFADDWSLFYLVDGRSVPSALLLVLVVADAFAVAAGFRLAYRIFRARMAERLVLALGGVPLAIAVVELLAFLPRLRVDGTFHQVSARFGTRPVAGGPLGWAILWMDAMIVAGMVVAARALTASSRTSPQAASAPEGAPRAPVPLLGRRRR